MQSASMKHKGNIQWDEDNLHQIESEKPVRTRISEPKTPFYPEIEDDGSVSPACHCSGNASYTAHAEAVQNALNEMLLRQHCHCEDTKSLEDGADALTLDEDAVKDRSGLSFQEQRKVHYNEFQKMRELSGKDILLDVAVDEDNSVSSGLKAMHTEEGTEDTLQLN